MMAAAREIAETSNVKAVCCFTHSGATAVLAARERPRVPIIALTPFPRIARKMTLVWGLHCAVVEEVERFKLAVVSAARIARRDGFATETDKIVVTAGVPFNQSGTTNILRVALADEKAIYEGEPA
jgi:pyruvate kinase